MTEETNPTGTTGKKVSVTSVDTPGGTDTPTDPTRRRLLGGMALAGAALATSCHSSLQRGTKPGGAVTGSGAAGKKGVSSAALDAALREHIRHVVVIYAENRSFNNLFADFPGLESPLAALKPEQYRQIDRDGKLLKELPPVWHGMVPHKQVVDHRSWHVKEHEITGLPNAPFVLTAANGHPLPQGVVTRDLWHVFYENQRQINGGKNNGFVAWGNSGALVMGYYANMDSSFRLWNLARQYTLCDNFFMGAFGGSFLNHHYLVAARPGRYPGADKDPLKRTLIAQLEGDDPTGILLKEAPDSPPSAMQGPPKTAGSTRLTPDLWAVNTMSPPYAPAFSTDPNNPSLADPNNLLTLPPQAHTTIGDQLSVKGIDWAWYAGGWQLALDGGGAGGVSKEFPQSPNFQAHHQPFNFFKAFAPGTAARTAHLRDGGVGDIAKTNHLIADIEEGKLPAVTFYKPQGNLNMHAGYSDVDSGDRHIARVVDALQKSALWSHTMVVITFDENGGWWDHVAPPKGDRWGPGSRIPALVVSPHAKRDYVDHTIYDTGSILRFINRRFGLDPLPGLVAREQAMLQAGGKMPGDLTATLDLG